MNSLQPPHQTGSPRVHSPRRSLLVLPREVWVMVCRSLQEDWRKQLLVMIHEDHSSRQALASFGLTCKAFYQLSLFAWNEFVEAYRLSDGRIEELREAEKVPEVIADRKLGPTAALERLHRLEKLTLWALDLPKPDFRQILNSKTLTRLTIRCSKLQGEYEYAPAPNLTEDALHSVLRKSNLQTLDLDYPSDRQTNVPQRFALLALIPSLKSLSATPRSFRALGQLQTTLSAPQLRHLYVLSDVSDSVNKAYVLSFLRRCSRLETLHVNHLIRSKALAPGELPINLPHLLAYEGQLEYLTLVHAPALRRAMIKSFPWDGGVLIDALASASDALESLVLELTSKMDDPVMREVKVSLRI